MIPSDVRLYTWIDVEDVFLRAQREGRWPEWLVSVRAYWDDVTLAIAPGSYDDARQWLADAFDPRFDGPTLSIILESAGNHPARRLPIRIEETDEKAPPRRLIPSLGRPSILVPDKKEDHPEPLPEDWPPIVAFHSFKGGVGRTLLALTMAQRMVERTDRQMKVLLVDADLEAPGISWVLRSRMPEPAVCVADFLALVHGDPDAEARSSISLVAERLQDMVLDGIYVLPAFRSVEQFSALEIRPEHLVRGAPNPFILTHILGALGKMLEAAAVIVDLRAGLSEISAGLLLDPRVQRVLVTTLSHQSIEGTARLLALLAELAPPAQATDPRASIILSQVPRNELQGELISRCKGQIAKVAGSLLDTPESDTSSLVDPFVVVPFAESLLTLPGDWEEVMAQIRALPAVGRSLDDLIQDVSYMHPAPVVQPNELRTRRETLAKFAQQMLFAETGEAERFLTIAPLTRLATDFRSKVPVAVVVGAKGAGKTYTFLQIARRNMWQSFVAAIVGHTTSAVNAPVCPVLASKNLGPNAQDVVTRSRLQCQAILRRLNEPIGTGVRRRRPHKQALYANEELAPYGVLSQDQFTDYIRDGLQKNLHEGEWRDRWLDVIAWEIGFQVGHGGVGRDLLEHLRASDLHAVAILDGLEDLFQDLHTQAAQQTALRALLQDVPDWLEQQPQRPLGVLVFVRPDMVLGAIRQNAQQLIARYDNYALKWSPEEALRLASWIGQEAHVLQPVGDLRAMTRSELADALVPLWGRKLGKDRSREARTASWVLAALCDHRGLVQARDLVRLLHLAAKESVTDTHWADRLLPPNAIRTALATASREKIEEIKMENPGLREVFERLERLPEDQREVPFAQQELPLETSHFQLLEENGVIQLEGGKYRMPELFRQGLGFRSRERGRHPVLSRRAPG